MTLPLTIIMAAYNAGTTSPLAPLQCGEGNIGSPEVGELAAKQTGRSGAEYC